jgi:hypothetical protein
MRKYSFLLIMLFCGCVQSELQSRANDAAEHYVKSRFGNPKYFKSISFSALEKRRYSTSLDTALMYAGVDTNNHKRIEKYADSESQQRPDLATQNTNDLYDIKHNKLSYYLLTYSFRVETGGQKRMLKYRFELDTAMNVTEAYDITHSNTPIR